jgi:hypothetical protein
MATTESSAPAQPSTRELRGIALFRDHADEIRFEPGEKVWLVPSQHDATSVYEVTIGRRGESCECADYEFRGSRCLHIYAATISRAKTFSCDGCGLRFPNGERVEVGEDSLTHFIGDERFHECAQAHGVI